LDDRLTEKLRALDEEYGFADVPDGKYWVTTNAETTKPYESPDGDNDSFRVGWVITEGEHTGRAVGDFLRWFGDDAKAQSARRGGTSGMLKGISFAAPEHSGVIDETIDMLQGATEEAGAIAAFDHLFSGMGTLRMPIALVTSKKGYQNVRYVQKGGPVELDDPVELAAVTI
jgi:hypothetical protein